MRGFLLFHSCFTDPLCEYRVLSLLSFRPFSLLLSALCQRHSRVTFLLDEVDLKGHTKSLGSCKDYTSSHGLTSWCVRKWEEAGAVIVGKLNMHELGLGTSRGV